MSAGTMVVVEFARRFGHFGLVGHFATPPTNTVAVVQYLLLNFALKANAAPTTANKARDSNMNFTFFIKKMLFNAKS